MIQRAYITAWQAHAPWNTNEQIEQDLVICRAVTEIYADSDLRRQLAIRGGTVLHKVHLAPAARYSEDIDLVQTEAGGARNKPGAFGNRCNKDVAIERSLWRPVGTNPTR